MELIISARFNNHLYFTKDQQDTLKTYHNTLQFFEHDLCKTDNACRISFNNFDFIKKSFVYVITETVAEYPYPYFSEKTWKAINYKVPFLIVGGKGSLHQLRKFGFKTFGDWWNESYDSLNTAADRIDSIVNILKDLSKRSDQELCDIRVAMKDILLYNKKHIAAVFTNEIERLKEL